MSRGVFITFEGGEGVGKSTQIKLLETALMEQGRDVIVTREPGGTPAAEDIRNVLFDPKHDEAWTAEAETLMMYAARELHIKEVIAPALSASKIVLCDRYIDSTRVYQKECSALVGVLEHHIAKDYMPDMTLILDMDAETAMARVGSRGVENRNDEKDIAFYNNLRQGFLDIAKDSSERCVIVDAEQSIEAIAAEIIKVVGSTK